MRVSSCGKTMLIGAQACEDEWRFCRSLPGVAMRFLIIASLAIAALHVWLPAMSGAMPLVVLGAAVLTVATLLGVAQFTGVVSEILGTSDAGLVVLDVNKQSIMSYSGRLFGSTRQEFSFDDVLEVSSTRQRWDGQALSSGAVIRMYSGDNVVIPERLDSLEILILGYYIGLQSSSLELRPA